MRSHHKETVHTLRQCSSFSCIFSPHVTSNRMNLYLDLFLGLSPLWVTKQSTLSWEAWCATVPLKAYPVTRLTRKCDLRHICLLLVKWELLLSCLLFVLDINCRVRTLDVTRSAQWPEVQGFTKKIHLPITQSSKLPSSSKSIQQWRLVLSKEHDHCYANEPYPATSTWV